MMATEGDMNEKNFTRSILEWYDAGHRDLPWRRTKDPYSIWISEIMLQQTRIEAVIPYYHRFLSELPTVKDLAAVDDEYLMKLWQGLGYYSRARNLKKAATVIMNEYHGEFPIEAAKLIKLPGIGAYTAGAISSIAFGQPEPAVDGNVLRVIMRLLADERDIMTEKTRKAVTEDLRNVYPSGERAGLVTEGLMELGETVCIPNGVPLCEGCPLLDICLAAKTPNPDRYPTRIVKTKRRTEERTVLLLRHEGRYALQKRPDNGLLASMWEFPSLDGKLSENRLKTCLEEKGLSVQSFTSIGSATHVFSHIEWQMVGYLVELSTTPDGFLFVAPDELHNSYAVPTAFRHYLKQIT